MKKRILAFVMMLLLMVGMLSGCYKAIDKQEARNGVVRVMSIYTVTYYDYDTYEQYGTATKPTFGSGFGVGTAGEPTNIFVTNRHVIESEYWDTSTIKVNEESVKAYRCWALDAVYILKDDYAYTSATGFDASRASLCDVLYEADTDSADLAVLRCADTLEDRMALPLLDTDYELEVGDEVIALGFPGTSDDDDMLASAEHVTITEGKISLFRPFTYNGSTVDAIQHTATINGGNSGGPLITPTGEVIGVNTWSQSGSKTSDVASNNSIEIKYVTKILDDLDIDYDTRKPMNTTMVIGIAAGAAVVVVILLVILVKIIKKKHNPKPQPTPQPTPVPPVIPNDTGLRIQGVSGVFAGKRIAITPRMRIGRDPSCNELVYPANTPGVSGTHCVLSYQNGQLYLTDLGSSNGTYLASGQRLSKDQTAVLRIGDRFSLGSQNETFIVTGRGGI